MAGGIILFTVMALFLSPTVLIPFHGAIQFASNASRVMLHFKKISWRITTPFALAALPGAYLASRIVVEIPEDLFRGGLGIFIILMTWVPPIKNTPQIKGKFFILGFVTTFISIFVGATGPFMAPFYIREGLVKEDLVATKAACQLFLHLFKVLAYLSIGFQITEFGGLLAILMGVAFLGNAIGKEILKKMSDQSFMIIIKIIITLLAGQLMYQAILT